MWVRFLSIWFDVNLHFLWWIPLDRTDLVWMEFVLCLEIGPCPVTRILFRFYLDFIWFHWISLDRKTDVNLSLFWWTPMDKTFWFSLIWLDCLIYLCDFFRFNLISFWPPCTPLYPCGVDVGYRSLGGRMGRIVLIWDMITIESNLRFDFISDSQSFHVSQPSVGTLFIPS